MEHSKYVNLPKAGHPQKLINKKGTSEGGHYDPFRGVCSASMGTYDFTGGHFIGEQQREKKLIFNTA